MSAKSTAPFVLCAILLAVCGCQHACWHRGVGVTGKGGHAVAPPVAGKGALAKGGAPPKGGCGGSCAGPGHCGLAGAIYGRLGSHGGCGERYWGEWISEPPDCCDPCHERYGLWTGPRRCHRVIIDPVLWILAAGHKHCREWWHGAPCPYGYNHHYAGGSLHSPYLAHPGYACSSPGCACSQENEVVGVVNELPESSTDAEFTPPARLAERPEAESDPHSALGPSRLIR